MDIKRTYTLFIFSHIRLDEIKAENFKIVKNILLFSQR